MSGLSPEEKLVRIGRLTGSSFAALLGRSPYLPPSKAWEQQMGFETVEENLPMTMGTLYEDAIRLAAQHKLMLSMVPHQLDSGRYGRLRKPSSTYHAAHGDWLVVHPDGEFLDARQIIQCKRHDYRAMRAYGMPGSQGEVDNDIVPVHELIQCQIELECVASNKPRGERAEWRVCWLAVECGEAEGPRLYRIVRDSLLIAALLDRGKSLWDTCMQGKGVKPDDAGWQNWKEGTPSQQRATALQPIKFTPTDLMAAPITEIGAKR